MKHALLYLWQLPQHLLGLVVWVVLKLAGKISAVERSDTLPGNTFVIINAPGIGVSLGRYIFLDKAFREKDRSHERGHSVQSLWLGPLYLFAVGLPSITRNVWDRLFHKNWPGKERSEWYYSRWPEKQADRLGGVERERIV